MLGLAAPLSSCVGPNHALEGQIWAACLSGDPGPFDLSQIPQFPWDRLFVFPPYTTAEELKAELGDSWSESLVTDIEHRDDITLLVFVYNDRMQDYVEPERSCDFSNLGRSGGWAASSTIFAVESRMIHGQLWVTLHPLPGPDDQNDV